MTDNWSLKVVETYKSWCLKSKPHSLNEIQRMTLFRKYVLKNYYIIFYKIKKKFKNLVFFKYVLKIFFLYVIIDPYLSCLFEDEPDLLL